MSNLQDVFKKNAYDLKQAANKSRSWYQQQALLLARQQPNSQSVFKGAGDNLKNTIMPGMMYMFMYDPKTKDDLPYYDVFPLVFPFKKTEDGFIGLNFHYLPYQPRVQLLSRLLEFANNTKMDQTTRIKYSWSLINGVSKFKWAEPCVKRYLNSHIKTRLRMIPAQDWTTALLLPVEQFVGASKAKVWKDSMR